MNPRHAAPSTEVPPLVRYLDTEIPHEGLTELRNLLIRDMNQAGLETSDTTPHLIIVESNELRVYPRTQDIASLMTGHHLFEQVVIANFARADIQTEEVEPGGITTSSLALAAYGMRALMRLNVDRAKVSDILKQPLAEDFTFRLALATVTHEQDDSDTLEVLADIAQIYDDELDTEALVAVRFGRLLQHMHPPQY